MLRKRVAIKELWGRSFYRIVFMRNTVIAMLLVLKIDIALKWLSASKQHGAEWMELLR